MPTRHRWPNWPGRAPHRNHPGTAEEVIGGYVERHGIDLLVLGAYGHSRIRELLLGSTTTALIRRCLVPALVVR